MLLGRRGGINQSDSLTEYSGRIIVSNAGPSGAGSGDIRDNCCGADFEWLCNHGNAHFSASRNLPAPFVARSSVGKSGPDSRRYDNGRGVAGLGHARSKNSGQHGQPSHRNVALPAVPDTSELWSSLLLRTIRLVVYPAEIPLCFQRRHFFERQSRILSIRAAAAFVTQSAC